MSGVVRSVLEAVFPDQAYEAAAPRPTSYEDVHFDVQSILIPPTFAKGLTVQVLQSLNKSFALQHKVALEPGPLVRTPFGMMPDKGKRFYSAGGILTHVSESGGKHRLSAQYDVENHIGSSTFISDVYGDGRLRFQGQLVDNKAESTEWGLTTTLRGEDYVMVQRLKHGPEAALSYNQRLAPGSPVTVGGELCLNYPAFTRSRAAARGADGGAGASDASAAPSPPPRAERPLEWAIGAAYDAGMHKTALHLATTRSFVQIASIHHLFRVTDRAHLAAKFMYAPISGTSMTAVGYRMKFRNTGTVLHGALESYGTLSAVVEREPMKGVKVGASMETRLLPASAGAAKFGFRVAIGAVSPITPPLSPCTMSRDIFAAAS